MTLFKMILCSVIILIIVPNNFVSCLEKGSLSFVVDNTASMAANRVKNAINSIAEVFNNYTVHEEKILVTFNDPEVNLHSVSTTQKEFQNALSTLTFREGGDCLENALTGVELALNRSQYGSHLYVFTDNPPKDSELTDRTIELCQEKNVQVVFIIFPNQPCLQWNVTFLPYYKIAQACPGQIFRLREASDAAWIIPYVKETVESPTIPLTAKIMEPTALAYKWNIIEFTTDELIEYAVISISGYSDIKDKGDFENKVWIQNNKVRKLSTGTGKQYVGVHASDIASVVVIGRTNFDFQYGFSEFIALNMSETVKQPTAGARTYLSIFTVDPKEVVAEVISAQILDMRENLVLELPLQSTLQPLYFSDGFSVPDTKFKIAINVKVKTTGNIVKRIKTTPIQPKVSSDTDDDDGDMKIYLINGESKNITCPLKADNLHNAKWYRNGELQSEFRDIYYPITNAKSIHDGNYTCIVNNKSANFIVDVGWKVVPEGSDYWEQNWDGNDGQRLKCEESSKLSSKYEWFLNGKPIPSAGDGKTISITDWGDYICRVRNVHGDLLILFHITSDGCVINKTLEEGKNIPLMLNTGSHGLLNLAYSNEPYMIVPKEKILTLSCHERNVFVKFPEKNQLTAKCVDQNQFMIDEKLYAFSDLHCNQQIIPIIKDTKQNCFVSTDSTIIRIGFNEKTDFITVFEACVNLTNDVPHFAKINITRPDSEGTDYSTRYVYGVNDTTVGNDHKIGNDTYTVGQLVDSTDVPFGPAQLGTYIPNWNQILILQPPEATAAWSSLEGVIRKAFRRSGASELSVVTGISNVTKTEDGLLVPRYLWKWIQNLDSTEIIVAIYVNHPTPDASDRRCHKESSCIDEPLKEELPRLYCCDQEDFKRGFPWIKF